MIAGLAAVARDCGRRLRRAFRATSEPRRWPSQRKPAKRGESQRQREGGASRSRKETASALTVVESQKAKAEAAERLARAAEEEGRKLLYTTDMQLAPFLWNDDRTTAEQLRLLLAKHIPDRAAVGTQEPPPPPSPICAALSGTTTSTCWKTAPRFSRGTMRLGRRRCFHREWSTGDAGSERPVEALGPGFARRG